MERKEDAVDGLYTFLVSLSSLESCCSCQKTPECRGPAEASDGSGAILYYFPWLLVSQLTYLAPTTALCHEFLCLTICCKKCILLLHLLLDHFSGYLLVLELCKVMNQFVPIYLQTTGGISDTCHNLPHSYFFQFEA